MADNGLLGGIAEGLKQGLISYQTMKGIQHQNQQLQMMGAEHGLVQDQSGNWTPSPDAQVERQAKAAENRQKIEALDPNSASNQNLYAGVKSITGVDLPKGLVGPQIKDLSGYAESKAKVDAVSKEKALDRQLKEQERQEKRKEKAALPSAPGEISADRAFGKDYEEYVAAGGYAGVQNNLAAAKQALELMKTGGAETGGFLTKLTPDGMLDMTNPKLAEAQQNLEKSIQASLRQTLGAQFTEREGVGILKRTFNKNLPTNVNIRNAEAVIADLEKRAQAKELAVQHYEANGTLKGFKGGQLLGAQAPSGGGLVHGGGAAGGATPSSQPVRMKDPHGNIRLVPADQVEAAKAAGGVLIGGQ